MLPSARRLLLLALPAALVLLLVIAAFRAGAYEGDPAAPIPDEAILLTAPPPGGPDAGPMIAPPGSYESPINAAPRPFTHMLLRWEAARPAGAAIAVEVRASLDGNSWSEWGAVEENPDLWVPEDGEQLFWGQEIYAGEGAQFWQVRAALVPSPEGALPELRQINVFTVDARFGPPDPAPDTFPDDMSGIAAASPRPPVVSRSAWGSPDGQGSRATPAYRAVTHMVVHHTADSNSLAAGQRWSDRVRAIWSFHTITRGWGDIGYNYLIDPNGVVYEGRAGGDDAVGFHDTANYGSMGVAVIGTYSSALPTSASQDSLVALLAWKAGQKNIDPHGAARYHGCAISQYCAPYSPNAVVSQIAGHRDVTPGRTTCPGDAFEGLLPAIRQRVAERLGGGGVAPPAANVELLGVRFDRTTVAAGELLRATFTVRNSGSVAVASQAPEAARDPAGGSYNLAESYVYDEGECFLGAEGQSYPAYPKEDGRVRLMLGPAEDGRQPACAGGSGGYPWRWGLNGGLAPGETREVVGYLRLRTPGTVTLRAGVVHEYVRYMAENVAPQTITVTPERQVPSLAAFDERLQPVAHVFRLGDAPDNLLTRASLGASVARGAYVGSFPWQGEAANWGDSGPLAAAPDVVDRFMVEQSRAFIAPVAGVYTFQLTGEDGGWLWVDGLQLIGGAPPAGGATQVGTITLQPGRHRLAFRGIERGGGAQMGYAVQIPGESRFTPLSDGSAGAIGAPVTRLGATFRSFSGMALAADDMGGAGVSTVRVSINGGPWAELPGPVAELGPLPDGSYSVRYQALDAAGNGSEERTLSFRVDSALAVYTTSLPLMRR